MQHVLGVLGLNISSACLSSFNLVEQGAEQSIALGGAYQPIRTYNPRRLQLWGLDLCGSPYPSSDRDPHDLL